MSALSLAPVIFGLAAAMAWGASDFTGGMLARRLNVYGVVVGGEAAGVIVLLALALLTGEPFPPLQSWLLAGLAGLGGGFGLTLLYRALASGQMSVAAPISAVLGAAIPVLFSAFVQGWPGRLTTLGFILALVAIWLVSASQGSLALDRARLKQLALPAVAGVVFGLFFILLHRASQEAIFWPIITTRLTSMVLLSGIAVLNRQPWLPPRPDWSMVALSGLLDAAGNTLYVLAGQFGRLDIAVVLSSLYPASTVLLAWSLLKERLSRLQLLGVLFALLAILLISL
jgi:drug/metabolite transporter (DMT)-like permease